MRSIHIELKSSNRAFASSQFIRRDYNGVWSVMDSKGMRLVNDNMNSFVRIATDPVRLIHTLENWDDLVNFATKNDIDLLTVLRSNIGPYLMNNIMIESVN